MNGIFDTTNFTQAQLRTIIQYEEELKKRKQDTDNDTRDRTAEKKKLVQAQMQQLATVSRNQSKKPGKNTQNNDDDVPAENNKSPTQPSNPDENKPTHPTQPDQSTDKRDFNVPLPPDFTEDNEPTYQPSLLSGVAKAMEKTKKEEKKKKR